MRIGVITYWDSKDNYGQMLQLYAMQAYLKKHGHQPFLIRYKADIPRRAEFRLRNIFNYVLKFPLYLKWFLNRRKLEQEKKIYAQTTNNELRKFSVFLQDNVEMTPIVYTSETIVANPPQADAYICGSDQIWGSDWAYYLNFAPLESIKIAYAPSFGGAGNFNDDYKKELQRLLARFDFVGIREQSGVELCKDLQRLDAVKVIDPTLLLGKEDYEKIRIPVNIKKPYLLLYLLGNPIQQSTHDFYAFAKKNSLDVIYVASQGKNDEFEKYPAQVGEFIDLVANAEYVITNSFHCTVFSLLYHRKFLTIPLVDGYERMNCRVEDLLEESGLITQLCCGDLDGITVESLNFQNFDDYISKQQRISENYLLSYLKC